MDSTDTSELTDIPSIIPSIKVDLGQMGPPGSHWEAIDALREEHRFFWNEEGPGYWVATRYDDIREAFQTPSVFSNHSIVATNPDPVYRFLPSFTDPPEHMLYRHAMNGWFSPGSVAKYVPRLRELAAAEVAAVIADGGCDFVTTFGDNYSVKCFLTSMGLGLDDADFFVDAVHRLSGNSGGGDDAAGRMMAAWADIAGYWTRVLADRREHPLDPAVDFVTHLTNGKLGDRPMPDLDIVDVLVTLTLGSLDNLKIQLSWALWHLATTPVDRERIVADPSLIPGAVEEFLRVFPIVSMARKLTTDIDFHGCPMKKNDMVLLQIQSATRDPRVFPDADKVIIDRSPNRHMAFGISEHRCLGSHLARAEMMVALEEWNRAIPDYRIDPDAPPLEAIGGQIALPSLPLVWDVAASSAGE